MKIFILSTVHNIEDTRIFYKEIISLKKKYHDISFIVSSDKKDNFVKNNVNIIPLPTPKSKYDRIKNQRIAWRIIKQQKPSIVHFHDPELIALGFLIKKRLNTKVIFDIHENISASFKDNLWIPSLLKPFLPKIYNRIEKLLIKDFDALIIAESSYKEIYGKKAVEIFNYPILPNTKKIEKDFSKSINLVYIGGIWKRRGAFKMLTLLKRLIENGFNVSLFLVGPFVPTELRKEVEEYIIANKLNKYIKIFGRVSLDEVYKILGTSHLGISLMEDIGNYRNSLSTKIFEYMAHSIPYIVSDFEIYDKYTVKSKTGITVNYYDDNEIYNKVKDLLSDSKKMDRLGKNGLHLVKTVWNWETQEKILFSVYEKVIMSKDK